MKKKVVMFVLVFVLFLMSAGYSLYSSFLKVEGTSNIDSNFIIKVTDIKESLKEGKATSITNPTFTNNTATFNAKLSRPGDNIEYEVTLTNSGTIDGKIENIVITNPSSIVKTETRGISKGQILKSGENLKYIVRVYIDKNSKITEDVTSQIEVKTDIVQDDKQIFNEGIDGTSSSKLEINNITLTSSYTSITSTISAKGEGLQYYYSLDNENFVEGNSSYTFNNLEVNKRYTVYYKIEDSNNNYVTSSKYINTKSLDNSTITVENEDKWTTSKKVTIKFPEIEGTNYYYKLGNDDYINTISTTEITLDKNTTVYIKMEVGSSVFESYKEITKIDNNNPTLTLTTSKTTNSITVIASSSSVSGISKYEFSLDGETWIDNGKYNNYTFKNLTHDTDYEVYVRVTNNSNLNLISNAGVKTNKVETPLFTEDTMGVVEITYPDGCGEELTCSYLKNDEEENVSSKKVTVGFSEDGTLVAKVNDGINYVTSSSYTVIIKTDTDYVYNEDTSYYEYNVLKNGYYKIELYGAQGGSNTTATGGMGAYTNGEIYLEKGDVLYVYVGSQGKTAESGVSLGGYNGGGNARSMGASYPGSGGGGATDVRIGGKDYKNRIMVAGGGGGAGYKGTTDNWSNGAEGGTLVGGKVDNNSSTGGYQSKGGVALSSTLTGSNGSFGIGGASAEEAVGGGGGGYYGGAGASWAAATNKGGAGGSSFISGYAGVNAVNSSSSHTNNTLHYSNKYFINTEMKSGVNTGNGKAKIVYLGEPSSPDSTKIKNVRYIKDCINGNTVNDYNHWVEIQAIKNGVNVAKNKSISSTNTLTNYENEETDYWIVDGLVDDASKWVSNSTKSFQCAAIDLGSEYNLEEIAVWHYYGDGRSYNENVVSVASSEGIYRELYNDEKVEVSSGNHIKYDSYKPVFFEDAQETETIITITYPEGCGSNYTCGYQKNNGEVINVDENSVDVSFTASGSLKAFVKENDTVLADNEYKVIRNSLYVSSTGNDETGDGSLENPYKTIKNAYLNAYENSTIYIMNDITQEEKLEFNQNKNIILTSYNGVHSIIKSSSLTTFLLKVTKGDVTFKNITLDGNNVSSNSIMVYFTESGQGFIENGTTIKNALATVDAGFGVWGGGKVTMNGGTITENKSSKSGYTGGVIVNDDGLFIMNGGTITNNTGGHTGGVWIGDNSEFVLNGGEITNNTGSNGGFQIAASTSKLTINSGKIDGNNSSENSLLKKNISLIAGKINDISANFVNDTKDYVLATALNNDYVIDVTDAKTVNGTNLQMHTSSKNSAQKWKIMPIKVIDGIVYYVFQSQIDGTQYIWIDGNSSTSGTNINTYELHNANGGYFSLSKHSDGYYEIKNINNLCIDVANGSSLANGNNVWAYRCNKTTAQKWKIQDFDQTTAVVTNSISMSSWKSSKGSYQTCFSSNWEDYSYNFNISISGGSVSSGKLCYASSSSNASSYCGTYSTNAQTGYGTACFNSSTNWVYYRSSACAYAYATGSHGLSTSRFQC